ncbi:MULTISPECIES: 3'-5' exonuclease [unclassified Anabaena]|uniref:3'-5' exonuclease n=1 Tax=unclassified Anabaena TaxID=2619674 RepID=UPI00082CAF49|nr:MULTISPECIES: 3'-5' exonuclease [unclassified Anabaena]
MPYLSDASAMRSIVAEYTQATTLWIDTEVAEFNTRNPRLSLIQVLDDPDDMSGDRVYLFDVLHQPQIIAEFIDQIMLNPAIEKVFHNANYDIKFLGNKQAKNITCTLELAKKIPYHILPLPNYQLQTLATTLCNFNHIDKQEQTSDWGRRPLSETQIEYAYLDCIYLAQIHQRLLELQLISNPDPQLEDVAVLSENFTEIEEQWKLLNSEYEHLKERLKRAMEAQNLSESAFYKLSSSNRKVVKVQFLELASLVQNQGISLDFPVTLTQKLQKDLGENLEQLSVDIETSKSLRLLPKKSENEKEEE